MNPKFFGFYVLRLDIVQDFYSLMPESSSVSNERYLVKEKNNHCRDDVITFSDEKKSFGVKITRVLLQYIYSKH